MCCCSPNLFVAEKSRWQKKKKRRREENPACCKSSAMQQEEQANEALDISDSVPHLCVVFRHLGQIDTLLIRNNVWKDCVIFHRWRNFFPILFQQRILHCDLFDYRYLLYINRISIGADQQWPAKLLKGFRRPRRGKTRISMGENSARSTMKPCLVSLMLDTTLF